MGGRGDLKNRMNPKELKERSRQQSQQKNRIKRKKLRWMESTNLQVGSFFKKKSLQSRQIS